MTQTPRTPAPGPRHRPQRIALPNKGTLAPGARRLLTAAGYTCSTPDRLHRLDPRNNIEFLHIRARDIPRLIAHGHIDAGITGRDLVADTPLPLVELLTLGFGHAQVRYAVPHHHPDTLNNLHGLRIATSLPHLTATDLATHGIKADIIEMTGAVEIAIHLGLAHAIADVVDTGRTLDAHHLKTLGPPLITTQAVLITTPATATTPHIQSLTQRLMAALLPATT
ncbi:ATP phosphoribosyltransferase [Streptomyces sp. NPDC088258]|uniref:ATP phosphoribosyltransferase n=1 Tax=Streptomyces sp. NPDC088258 TaxID=3365849 RepID=UPI0037FAF034